MHELRGKGMKTKTKIMISLVLLGVVDMIIPVPILGFILIYVVLEKPTWFRRAVHDIYQ